MYYRASVDFIRLYILILCATYFSNAIGVTWTEHFPTRYRRLANCGFSSLQCHSGDCVDEDKLCDGKEDCQDGSDENDCKDILCPPRYLFKCNYGACISKHLMCDGKSDCKDNSDEIAPACKNTNPVKRTPKNCGPNSFQCDSGECIDDNIFCDGKEDCQDGLDETYTVCQQFSCPRTTFRCNYGACISKSLVCDGKSDCRDNSDEIACSSSTSRNDCE